MSPSKSCFYAAVVVVFQDRSEKRVIEIRIRSRIQSLFILVTYTVGLAVEAWDLTYQRSYCGIIIDL